MIAIFPGRALAFAFALHATGCYVEGNSFLLSDGPIEHFLSMGRCEREATASYTSGSPRFAGYRCRQKFLGFTTATREYSHGQMARDSD